MVKLTPYNPKWALLTGIILNVMLAIIVIMRRGVTASVVTFLLVNLILKGVPLYTIYKTKTTINDIYAIIGLFATYTLWVNVNGTTIVKQNVKIYEAILHSKNESPIMHAVSKIPEYIHF
jgi:hypothetical protein